MAVGDFAFAAMENWGLMTYRDTVILHDEEKATVLEEDQLVQIVSHEVGHQVCLCVGTMRAGQGPAVSVVWELGDDEVVGGLVAERRVRQVLGDVCSGED